MHDLPDLTFPGVSFGVNEKPWDLRPWLYRGGAKSKTKDVFSMIEAGKLGLPMAERMELVRRIRETLLNYLQSGGQRSTVHHYMWKVRLFFQWADENANTLLSLSTVEQAYRDWCDALTHRVRVGRELSERSAHTYAQHVGGLLDRVLERGSPLVRSTQLKLPKTSPRALSPKADKQNLEQTFAFGHFLMDLADGLSVNAIWGPLPLHIHLRCRRQFKIDHLGVRRISWTTRR